MRPGLDKPAALPLLALILFSLLTLVPSLSSIYNLKFADFAYYTGSARRMSRTGGVSSRDWHVPANGGSSMLGVPLIQDSLAQVPTDPHLADPRKSWIQAAPSRPRGNRSSRSSRVENGAPSTTTKAAAADNRNRAPHAATDSSFMFGRRARALRAYLAQQLGDYQLLLAPFSNRSLPTDSDLDSNPKPASRSLPTCISDRIDDAHLKDLSGTFFTSANASSQQRSPPCTIWQQACHSALELWGLAKESPFTSAIHQAIQPGSHSLRAILAPGDAIAPPSNAYVRDHKDPSATGHTGPPPPVPKDKAHALPAGQTTDAAGRHSPQLQGSCMAVVIGLVAGIMWF